MELEAILWFGIGWFVGGFVNGITGFGAAMAAMPFVALGMNLRTAIPACSLMVLVVSIEQGWRYAKLADWPRVYPLLIGAVPGTFAGVYALRYLPPTQLQLGLGLFLVLYAVWSLVKNLQSYIIISAMWGYVAGFFSTMFGTAFSFNGPPLAIYTSLSGWNKEMCKAGLSIFFISTCIMMVGAQIVAGLHGTHTLYPLLVGIPGGVVGSFLGFLVSKRMADKVYHIFLFSFIGLSGFIFVYQALSQLIER